MTISLEQARTVVDADAWVAPGATVAGAVTLGPGSSVWYGAVLLTAAAAAVAGSAAAGLGAVTGAEG